MFTPIEINTLNPKKKEIAYRNIKRLEKEFGPIDQNTHILTRPYSLLFRFPECVKADFYYTTNCWKVGTETFHGEAWAFIGWYKQQKEKALAKSSKPDKKIKPSFWIRFKKLFSNLFSS